eukprot:271952-Pelagomonas_calceolata.AAC.2
MIGTVQMAKSMSNVVRSGFSAQDSERSFGSLASSFSGKSFITGKSAKLELKRKFYENLSDFKSKVVLHKEPGCHACLHSHVQLAQMLAKFQTLLTLEPEHV